MHPQPDRLDRGRVLAALPALALPAGEPRRDIPITDPTILVSLGFEPDATDVYATPQAFEELLMTPQERAAVQRVRLEEYRIAQEGSSAGGSFGTGTSGFSPIAARAIRPERSETEFRRLRPASRGIRPHEKAAINRSE